MIDTSQILRNLNPVAFEAMKSAYSAAETQQVGETGKALGYVLKTMADPGESLQDAMEEISMSFEEKKLNDIGRRKLGELRGKSSLFAAIIDKWMKTMPDMPEASRFEKLLLRIRTLLERGGTPEDLLKLLDEDDAAKQHAMLDVLEESGGLDAEGKKLVQAAKALLARTRGEEVRAGLNLAAAINARTTDAGELKELRSLYRNEVLGFRTPQECFRSLLAHHGPEAIRQSIDFLIEACGIDLQSASPSKSEEELSRILGDLQCVDTLTAGLDRTNALVSKMDSQFGEKCAMDGTGLMARLVDLTEKPYVDAGQISALVNSTGLQQLLAKVYFVTCLVGIVRQFSSRLFADEESRARLVDAMQDELDGLVAEQQAVDETEQGGEEEVSE